MENSNIPMPKLVEAFFADAIASEDNIIDNWNDQETKFPSSYVLIAESEIDKDLPEKLIEFLKQDFGFEVKQIKQGNEKEGLDGFIVKNQISEIAEEGKEITRNILALNLTEKAFEKIDNYLNPKQTIFPQETIEILREVFSNKSNTGR